MLCRERGVHASKIARGEQTIERGHARAQHLGRREVPAFDAVGRERVAHALEVDRQPGKTQRGRQPAELAAALSWLALAFGLGFYGRALALFAGPQQAGGALDRLLGRSDEKVREA